MLLKSRQLIVDYEAGSLFLAIKNIYLNLFKEKMT